MIHVVLFQPEKPSNTGNIMRTCVATNSFLHIIGPLTFSLNEKDLKRAGMDYIDSLKYQYYDSLDDFYRKNKNALIYYVSRYGKQVYSNVNYSNTLEDVYIMFGRESTGIPHDVLRKNYNYVVRLPMVASTRSLNLSNCVAIMVYEILRQQGFPSLSTSEAIKGEDFLFKKSK